MKRNTIRNTLVAALLAGTTSVGTIALAQGYGSGWGMMRGYGPGNYAMGPWMMGGYGEGYYGMGPGMMWGYGARYGSAVNLSDEQRTKIDKIENDARTKQWDLMGKMHEEQSRLFTASNANKPDETAISKGYKKIADLRQQMYDTSRAAQKQVDTVLTKEQRDQLAGNDYGWGCGY